MHHHRMETHYSIADVGRLPVSQEDATRTGTEDVKECIYQDLIPPVISDKKNMDAMDAGKDMNSVTVTTGRGGAHKGQDSGVAPISTAGVTRTRAPGPLGQFQTCLVKPLARFLTIPYLHAQRILQLSRTVHVFHMQSTYIARQAIHLVILLNDVVDVYEGPDEEQYQERIELGDELIELFDAMQEWGANSNEGLPVGHDQFLVKINQQYSQFFRERFYFHNVRDSSDDFIFGKLRAYDQRTIDFRKWQHLHTVVSIGVGLKSSVAQDHAMPSLQDHVEGALDDNINQSDRSINLEAKHLQGVPAHSSDGVWRGGHSSGGDNGKGRVTSLGKRLGLILDSKLSAPIMPDAPQPSSVLAQADMISDPTDMGMVSVFFRIGLQLLILVENNNDPAPWQSLRVLAYGAVILNFVGIFLLVVAINMCRDVPLAGFNVTGRTPDSPAERAKNFHQAGMLRWRTIAFEASGWGFIASGVCALASLAFWVFLDLQMLVTVTLVFTPAALFTVWISLRARRLGARRFGDVSSRLERRVMEWNETHSSHVSLRIVRPDSGPPSTRFNIKVE